jgi:hypothetical protein
MDANINYWAVLLAAMVYYTGGILWYSPLLFGRTLTMLISNTEEQRREKQKRLWKLYISGFFSALIMSYILALVIYYTDTNTYIQGIKAGFLCWLGFVVTTNFIYIILAKGSYKLFLIHSGYQLYGLLAMGVILAI